MVNETNIQATPPYASSSALGNYSWEELQEFAAENMHRGYEPYETYPAKWHNSVLHQLTVTLEQIKVYCDSIQAELKNVLLAAGKTPDPAQTNQLAQSIAKLSDLQIATASVLGGVKSTVSDWGVSVDGTTGVMSVNTTDATTAKKGIVKLNDTLTSSSATEALTAKQGKALRDAIEALDTAAPTASGNATSFIDSISQTNGKISATKKTIPNASTTQKGIVNLKSAGWGLSSADGTVRTVDAARGTKGILAFPPLPSGQTESITRFLREDNTWQVIAPSLATTESIGSVPELPYDENRLAYFLSVHPQFGTMAWIPAVPDSEIEDLGTGHVNSVYLISYTGSGVIRIQVPAHNFAMKAYIAPRTGQLLRIQMDLLLVVEAYYMEDMDGAASRATYLSFSQATIDTINNYLTAFGRAGGLGLFKHRVHFYFVDIRPDEHSLDKFLIANFAIADTLTGGLQQNMPILTTATGQSGFNSTNRDYALRIVID